MGSIWAFYLVSVNAESAPDPFKLYASAVFGGMAGAVVSFLVLYALSFVTQDLFEKLSPAVMAAALGMIAGYLLSRYVIYLFQIPEETDKEKYVVLLLITSFTLIFGYAGIALGLSRASSWTSLIQAVHKRQPTGANQKLVDTSVIIDGRLADICKSGFIEGTLLIPRFVLKELQNIADSSDVLRRARGRRGLDILKAIQDDTSKVSVLVIEDDPQDVQDVDGKLVRLARDLGAKILTNDFNLNKVAQIEGVQVLNINDLANALKPAVLPDEHMRVKIIKEGKEAFQGVGYLDDGTMIVVDGGKDHVGKDVSVLVTSVLQTTAGRMIFTKLQSVHS
jgi:uncharacterized protein YacL